MKMVVSEEKGHMVWELEKKSVRRYKKWLEGAEKGKYKTKLGQMCHNDIKLHICFLKYIQQKWGNIFICSIFGIYSHQLILHKKISNSKLHAFSLTCRYRLILQFCFLCCCFAMLFFFFLVGWFLIWGRCLLKIWSTLKIKEMINIE